MNTKDFDTLIKAYNFQSLAIIDEYIVLMIDDFLICGSLYQLPVICIKLFDLAVNRRFKMDHFIDSIMQLITVFVTAIESNQHTGLIKD